MPSDSGKVGVASFHKQGQGMGTGTRARPFSLQTDNPKQYFKQLLQDSPGGVRPTWLSRLNNVPLMSLCAFSTSRSLLLPSCFLDNLPHERPMLAFWSQSLLLDDYPHFIDVTWSPTSLKSQSQEHTSFVFCPPGAQGPTLCDPVACHQMLQSCPRRTRIHANELLGPDWHF